MSICKKESTFTVGAVCMTHLTFCSVFKNKTSEVRIQKDLVFFSLIMNVAVDFNGSPVVVF